MNIMFIIQEITTSNEFRLRNECYNKLNNLISSDEYFKTGRRHSCNSEKLTDEVEIGKGKFERLWLAGQNGMEFLRTEYEKA